MNIKEKLTLSVGILVALIVVLVALSTISLQILTATDPSSPAAGYGLERALTLILVFGTLSIGCGVWMLVKLPADINRPFKALQEAVDQIASHNYTTRLNLKGGKELVTLSENFNRMAKRLEDHRHTSMAKLKMQKQYIEAIIASIDEPIICINDKDILLLVNDAALQLLNIASADVVGRNASEIAMRNDLLRRLLNGLKDQLQQSETTNINKPDEPLRIYSDNKESYFQVKYIPVRMSADESQENGYIINLKNITEFHRLDMAKTTFISTISHEMKTPLASILMSQQLLADTRVGKLNDEQRELSDSIKENGERLLSITSELLNMTQVESGVLQLKPHITKPIELIRYAIKANSVQAEKFGINIEVDYPDEKISKLYVDSEKIAWVLTNLLSNAIRYSSEHGRVVIGAMQVDARHVSIYVQDFGRGIDPRYHESIFERYFRVPGTKVQGSGLGLSISRDFVEAHGGSLTLESEVGKGSKFIVTLSV